MRVFQNNKTQFMKTKVHGNKFLIDRMMLTASAGLYMKLRILCEWAARAERMDIRMEQNGDNLILAVSDDGPGIEPEHHDMVFRRYAQVKDNATVSRKGRGLGLAGANVISHCLGGCLNLESEKGKSATF